MYCRNCGKEVDPKAVACPACGVPPRLEKKYCPNCGSPTEPNQALCTKCGVSLAAVGGTKNRVAAALLAIFLGSLGFHKFYLGYTREGVVMLLLTLVGGLLTFGVVAWIMGVVGFIEGIVYLIRPDAEFEQQYVVGRRPWF